MEEREVLVEKKDGIAVIKLNRPERLNALTTNMYRRLSGTFREFNRDDSVKAVIITGSGKGFCAGSDVSSRLAVQLTEKEEESRFEALQPVGSLVLDMEAFDKPIIAAINGVAVGAGLSIALASHIRLASEKARFGAVWVKVGLIPDVGATYYLPRIVGLDNALKLCLTGEIIDAKEAFRIGLVTQVIPHDQLMVKAREFAEQIAKGPSIALELMVRGMKRALNNDLKTQLDYESYAQNICRASHDHKEGVQAFMEKREPVFRGR